MSQTRPNFGDTLHDWQADPSHWQAGALFQPKSLGTTLSSRRARRGARVLRFALLLIASGAGAVALLAFARVLHVLV